MRPASVVARTATGTAQTRPTPGTKPRSIARSESGAKVMLESFVTTTSWRASASGTRSVFSFGLTAPPPVESTVRQATRGSLLRRLITSRAGEALSAVPTSTS